MIKNGVAHSELLTCYVPCKIAGYYVSVDNNSGPRFTRMRNCCFQNFSYIVISSNAVVCQHIQNIGIQHVKYKCLYITWYLHPRLYPYM